MRTSILTFEAHQRARLSRLASEAARLAGPQALEVVDEHTAGQLSTIQAQDRLRALIRDNQRKAA